MSDKAIIARSIAQKADYSDSLLSEKKNRHIKQGGLSKSGAFLEIYHLASKQSAIFKAFLTSINDSFAVSFRAETAFGRSDPYRLYEGNERTISVGFDVPAYDIVEAMNNLAKISLVTSMLYPTYEETGQGINALQLKSPPIVRIKFANLITNTANPRGGARTAGLAVAISNFAITPSIDQGFFISEDKSGKGEMLYPKLFQLNLDMAVIHEHPLGFSTTSGFDLGSSKTQGRTPRTTATNAVKKKSSEGKAASAPVAAGMSTADGRSVDANTVDVNMTESSATDLACDPAQQSCPDVSTGMSQAKAQTAVKPLKQDKRAVPNTAKSNKQQKNENDAFKAVKQG